MKSVLCFGEALIDFLNIDPIEQDKISLPAFRQYPGGAPANAAVAVAKLGGNAKFAGQVGQDGFGDFLQNALEEYGVNTEYLARHPSAKTALAFVMLDEQGDRSFSFYRDDSADVLFEFEQVDEQWFSKHSILHFCSNTLTTTHIAETTTKIVEQARSQQTLVSFDVNLRHNLWKGLAADINLVNGLVALSDVVKFSKDELLYLSEGNPDAYIQACLTTHCKLLVITDGEDKIEFVSQTYRCEVIPPQVDVADTTAGGDAFVGGMLFILSMLDNPFMSLSDQSLVTDIMCFAACSGALAVTKPGAFPALPKRSDVSNMITKQNYTISAITPLIDEQGL